MYIGNGNPPFKRFRNLDIDSRSLNLIERNPRLTIAGSLAIVRHSPSTFISFKDFIHILIVLIQSAFTKDEERPSSDTPKNSITKHPERS